MFCFLGYFTFQIILRNIFKPRRTLVALEYAINIQTLIVTSKCCLKRKQKVEHPIQRKTITSILLTKLYSNTVKILISQIQRKYQKPRFELVSTEFK